MINATDTPCFGPGLCLYARVELSPGNAPANDRAIAPYVDDGHAWYVAARSPFALQLYREKTAAERRAERAAFAASLDPL